MDLKTEIIFINVQLYFVVSSMLYVKNCLSVKVKN